MSAHSGEFYQVGGYGGHVTTNRGWLNYQEGAMANIVWAALSNNNRLELTLGIEEIGASRLLIHYTQLGRIFQYCENERIEYRQLTMNSPHPISRFASLSPIEFQSIKEFEGKINSYKPKPKKKFDSSPANKSFVGSGQPPAGSGYRATFEQQRLVWQILTSHLSHAMFGLPDRQWAANVQFRAFHANTWAMNKDKVLDIGWTGILSSNLNQTPLSASSEHIEIKEHAFYDQRGKSREGFKYGTSQTVPSNEVPNKLKAAFASHDAPLILLVFDYPELRTRVLKKYGVDTTSWTQGTAALLGFNQTNSEPSSRRYNDRREQNSVNRRSRSPRRRDGKWDPCDNSANGGQEQLFYPSDSPQPEERRDLPAVTVIDVKAMFCSVSRRLSASLELETVLAKLGVQHDQGKWNAGNESHFLFEAWREMARGETIDEQLSRRWPSTVKDNDQEEKVKVEPTQEIDEDEDPNDIPSGPPATKTQGGSIMDQLERDDDDSDADYW